jgi:hypothetical protein
MTVRQPVAIRQVGDQQATASRFWRGVISWTGPGLVSRSICRSTDLASQGVFKMLKWMAALMGLLSSSFAGLPFAQAGADDLAGRWAVTWSNTSRNAMSLANKSGRFSGTYQNDDKDSCSVTGNFLASNQHLALQIVCPKWDIRMQGTASKDSKTIRGSYQAYVDGVGKFVMTKQ